MPSKPLSELETLVGKSVCTVAEFRIEAGKVAEFARAIKADDPVFFDATVADNRGLDAIPAPVTFPQVAFFERYRPEGIDKDLGFDLGFDYNYTVHGEQVYNFERPMYVGDVLTGDTTLLDIYQREGPRGGTMTFAIFETEYVDETGERVVGERSTRIETSGAIEDEPPETTGGQATESTERISRNAPHDRPPLVDMTDINVGDKAPEFVVGPLEREDFVRYAGASGDFSPLHYDEPHATAAGHPSVFAQGMFVAGVASTMVSRWVGIEHVRSFRTRFHSRVWPHDTIRVTGEVTECNHHEEGVEVAIDIAVHTQTREAVVTGDATALLPVE